MDTFFSLLSIGGGIDIEMPKRYPFQGEWGKPVSTYLLDRQYPIPEMLDMVYLSVIERRFYSVEQHLPQKKMEELFAKRVSGEPLFEYIVVGMAPYGGVAVWLYGDRKEVLVEWIKGKEVQVKMDDFLPMTPKVTLDENCDYYIEKDRVVKDNMERNGLPPTNLFDKYMQQFCYRYQVLFGNWNEEEEKWETYEEEKAVPRFDSLEEMLFDGTHDKLNDGDLMKYHEAGKPKKLAVKWHIKRWEYAAYFWFVDEEIRAVFDRFYGTHPETRSDLMVRIDPKRNKFQLEMYRQGLQEPYIIPETAYELLAFRNKFECFRSENYSQEKGAWVW